VPFSFGVFRLQEAGFTWLDSLTAELGQKKTRSRAALQYLQRMKTQ
jgi:hypothetical protein